MTPSFLFTFIDLDNFVFFSLLAVNGDSFAEMSHTEAVKYLSSLRGSIRQVHLYNLICVGFEKLL